jgi:hypothetical protein
MMNTGSSWLAHLQMLANQRGRVRPKNPRPQTAGTETPRPKMMMSQQQMIDMLSGKKGR